MMRCLRCNKPVEYREKFIIVKPVIDIIINGQPNTQLTRPMPFCCRQCLDLCFNIQVVSSLDDMEEELEDEELANNIYSSNYCD